VADRISLKHRSEPSVPRLPHTRANDVIAVLLGLAMYVVFALWLHQWLIGVSPFG
jgi:capsular polysaccharide biosynthesis protein